MQGDHGLRTVMWPAGPKENQLRYPREDEQQLTGREERHGDAYSGYEHQGRPRAAGSGTCLGWGDKPDPGTATWQT